MAPSTCYANKARTTELTFVQTWAGVAYVCFIVDAHGRMIVGWRVAGHMRTTMVLDAIRQVPLLFRWRRHPGNADNPGR
jgi:putative transposase